jgi:hypothetical protein
MKRCFSILIVALFVFVGFSASALPDNTDPFTNPQPTYEFDWVYGTGFTTQGNTGA